VHYVNWSHIFVFRLTAEKLTDLNKVQQIILQWLF